MRRHLSFANVVSLLALFVALGGSAYAVTAISGKQLKSRSVSGRKIVKNSLTGTEIAESKLKTVPRAKKATAATRATSALTATTAAHAGTADTAGNASTLGGFGPSGFVHSDRILTGAGSFGTADAPILSDPTLGMTVGTHGVTPDVNHHAILRVTHTAQPDLCFQTVDGFLNDGVTNCQAGPFSDDYEVTGKTVALVVSDADARTRFGYLQCAIFGEGPAVWCQLVRSPT